MVPIKILQIDVSTSFSPVVFNKETEHCRILIRYKNYPAGWVTADFKNGEVLNKQKLLEMISRQLNWRFIHTRMIADLNPALNLPSLLLPISIVICTRNRTALLKNCIDSLCQIEYPLLEIIIIDNAPSDNQTKDLATHYKNVRYVRENTPGLDNARNKGIKEAKFDIVAFTDDDAITDQNWLHAINNVFQDDNIMAVSGLVAPAELDTKAQQIFELKYGGMGHGFEKKVLNRQKLFPKELLWISNICIGTNMAFRKKVFHDAGMFDLALDVGTPANGGGDIEIFHRILCKGFTVVYEPAMLVWHHHRKEMKDLEKQIYNNGRGFGCYLLAGFLGKTVSRGAIIEFWMREWLYKWVLKNIFSKKPKFPRRLSFLELSGMLSSPMAFYRSKRRVKRLTHKNPVHNNFEG